jgi:hypothetical protein
MIDDVYEALGVDDLDHPAAGMFDAPEFVTAVSNLFERLAPVEEDLVIIGLPDVDGQTVGIFFHQWTGQTSARVDVSGPFPSLETVRATLLPFVVDRNLMLYDPQAKAVYNNRREYPSL